MIGSGGALRRGHGTGLRGPARRGRGRGTWTRRLSILALCSLGCSGPENEAPSSDAPREPTRAERDWATPDPRLLQAIDHYTGVAGVVDAGRAREMIFRLAEETASPLSRMWVARVYSRGRMGVERDTIRARALAAEVVDTVHVLARTGQVEAIFLMGTAYDEGLGRPVDYEEAVRWYRQAAEMDHVLAQHNLGNVYAEGRGIEQDHALAVRWWTPAAERGDAITGLRLGEAYEAGRGVEADTAVALDWYRRAASAGNTQAAEAVARLEGGGG